MTPVTQCGGGWCCRKRIWLNLSAACVSIELTRKVLGAWLFGETNLHHLCKAHVSCHSDLHSVAGPVDHHSQHTTLLCHSRPLSSTKGSRIWRLLSEIHRLAHPLSNLPDWRCCSYCKAPLSHDRNIGSARPAYTPRLLWWWTRSRESPRLKCELMQIKTTPHTLEVVDSPAITRFAFFVLFLIYICPRNGWQTTI